LLRFYRDWHTAYGGAAELNLESMGQFGPAGMIVAGMAFDKEGWSYLKESFDALERALTRLKEGGPLKNAAYLVLLAPYLGDPADPSLVDKWRENPKDCRTEWHDLAVKELAFYLRNADLYVPRSSRMQTRKPSSVEQMNNEFYSLYLKLREEGETKRKAIQTAADWCDYGESRAYEIVQVREGGEKRERKKA
jgi:hypothetical protein